MSLYPFEALLLSLNLRTHVIQPRAAKVLRNRHRPGDLAFLVPRVGGNVILLSRHHHHSSSLATRIYDAFYARLLGGRLKQTNCTANTVRNYGLWIRLKAFDR